MILSGSTIVLHGGAGHDVTFLTYLYRVLLSLVAIGGIAILVYWSVGVIDGARAS